MTAGWADRHRKSASRRGLQVPDQPQTRGIDVSLGMLPDYPDPTDEQVEMARRYLKRTGNTDLAEKIIGPT